MFQPWTEIESFHSIRKFTTAYPSVGGKVKYKSKVKLHGINVGIQCLKDSIIPQSRTVELSVTSDKNGFAKWVESTQQCWKDVRKQYGKDIVLYGEWVGPGVQGGVAVSQIEKKCLVVFAARIINDSSFTEEHGDFISEPEELMNILNGIPNVHVLPWRSQLTIDWQGSVENLEWNVAIINAEVELVEKEDPFVKDTFGISGVGEGLVYYPHEGNCSYETFCNLVFKAKGEEHKNIKTAAPAQLSPQVAESIQAFADMVLSEARLLQAVDAVTDGSDQKFDKKLIGKFLVWIANDVQKENKDELEASSLTWKQVQKAIGDSARRWYLSKMNES
jgi:hypothetical protein